MSELQGLLSPIQLSSGFQEKPNILKRLLTLANRYHLEIDIIQQIRNLKGYKDLFLLSAMQPDVRKACKDKSLNKFWTEEWTKIKDHETGCQMMEQPSMHSFDLLAGIHFYWCAVKASSQRQILSYLRIAELFGDFQAINKLNILDIQKIKEATEASNLDLDIKPILKRVKMAAKYHWTSGYIMLGKTQLELAKYTEDCLDEGDISPSQTYYYEALESFIIAEKLERFSKAALTRAYGNQSIAEVNNDKFKEWSDLWDHIVGLAGVDNNAMDAAFERAGVIVRLVLKSYNCIKNGLVNREDAEHVFFQSKSKKRKKNPSDELMLDEAESKQILLEGNGDMGKDQAIRVA